MTKKQSIPMADKFQLYVDRATELTNKRLFREGKLHSITFTVSWEYETGRISFGGTQLDEEDFCSFLLTFRQFIMNDEPINTNHIFNLAIRRTKDELRKQQLTKARETWKETTKRFRGIKLAINGHDFTPREVLDLWINGFYFHTDPQDIEKVKALNSTPFPKMQFLMLVQELTYLGSVDILA